MNGLLNHGHFYNRTNLIEPQQQYEHKVCYLTICSVHLYHVAPQWRAARSRESKTTVKKQNDDERNGQST